jgi:hypothetical protein
MSVPKRFPIFGVRGDDENAKYLAKRCANFLLGDTQGFPVTSRDQSSSSGFDIGTGNNYWLFDRGMVTLPGGSAGIMWQQFELAHRYQNYERLWAVARTLVLVEDWSALCLLNDDVETEA